MLYAYWNCHQYVELVEAINFVEPFLYLSSFHCMYANCINQGCALHVYQWKSVLSVTFECIGIYKNI